MGHGHHLDPPAQRAAPSIHVYGAVVGRTLAGANRNHLQMCPALLANHLPGNQVGVMLRLTEQDGIALADKAAARQALRHQVYGGCGARCQHDFFGRGGVEKPLSRGATLLIIFCRFVT